jgi:hypothetical protein
MEQLSEQDFYFIYEDNNFNEAKEIDKINEQVKIQRGLVIIVYSFSAEIEETIKHGLSTILETYGQISISQHSI